MKWRLVAGHVGGEERDRATHEEAVGDGVGVAVGPAEVLEGVQLDGAAEDLGIEGQGLASSARGAGGRGSGRSCDGAYAGTAGAG